MNQWDKRVWTNYFVRDSRRKRQIELWLGMAIFVGKRNDRHGESGKVRFLDKDAAKEKSYSTWTRFEAWYVVVMVEVVVVSLRLTIAEVVRESFQFSFPREQLSKMSTILLQCVGNCFHRRRMRTGSCSCQFRRRKILILISLELLLLSLLLSPLVLHFSFFLSSFSFGSKTPE